ncbi:MAG: hypothetical protein QOD06_3012, partial [Candidatus Binatota bacterium]|nr:hypothetical protein [Candidatus Binatota bacterium]
MIAVWLLAATLSAAPPLPALSHGGREAAGEQTLAVRPRSSTPAPFEGEGGRRPGEGHVADGATLYGRWCARCHGERGDGRGPAAPSLALNGIRPRDFTRGLFKLKSTPAGAAPTDDDLRRVIRDGLPGSPMPYFRDLLAGEEIDQLIATVRDFAARPPPIAAPLDLGSEIADAPEVRVRGQALYLALGCSDCHGFDGRGTARPRAEFRNDDGSLARPADLGRPWTFKGRASARDIVTRIATGIAGTPMPSYLGAVPLEEFWAVAHYVRSLAIAPSLEEAAIARAKEPAGGGTPLERRGEYLVKSGTCFLCHVQMNPDGSYAEGSFGAGGMRIEIATLGTVYSRNLTPDVETGLGSWSLEDFRGALRDGRSRNGRRLNPLDMPWTILAHLEERDVEAIYTYLRTLPPVRNLVPPPAPAGISGALFEKVGLLVSGAPIRGGFFPGNAAITAGAHATPDVENPSDDVVVLAVCLLLTLACLLRRGRTLLALPIVVAVGVVYTWPPLRLLPASLVRGDSPAASALALPPLRRPPEPVSGDDPNERALAERGRYLATIGTCPLCHTAGPSVTRPWAAYPEMGGGMKIEWKVFGTVYSRNLTPDRETGIGEWNDDELRR